MEAIKKIQKIKLPALLAVVAVLSLAIAGPATADEHETKPVFNGNRIHATTGETVFTPMIIGQRPAGDTGNITPERCAEVSWCELRDEADFLRLGQGDERYGQSGNELDICSDETLNFWFYAHNGTSEQQNNSAGDWQRNPAGNSGRMQWYADNANLDGPAVAHNTVVSLSLPSEAGSSHIVTASISADRAAEVTDTVTIGCSDESKEISLVYVTDQTVLSNNAPDHGSIGEFRLDGNLASEDGAYLGYGNADSMGIVPSCFDFASVIRGQIKVVVSEVAEVEEEEDDPEEDPETLPDPDPEENPDDLPDPDPEAEPDPVVEPNPEPPEGKPEDIPPLGGGTTTSLALVLFSAAVAGIGYRLVRSRR